MLPDGLGFPRSLKKPVSFQSALRFAVLPDTRLWSASAPDVSIRFKVRGASRPEAIKTAYLDVLTVSIRFKVRGASRPALAR